MSQELTRAGWRLRVNEYLSLRLASAIMVGVAGLLLLTSFDLGPAWLRWPLTFVMVLVGWRLPRFLLSRARKKRLARIEAQLGDSLLAMAKSLQVGSGFLQALAHARPGEQPAEVGVHPHEEKHHQHRQQRHHVGGQSLSGGQRQDLLFYLKPLADSVTDVIEYFGKGCHRYSFG